MTQIMFCALRSVGCMVSPYQPTNESLYCSHLVPYPRLFWMLVAALSMSILIVPDQPPTLLPVRCAPSRLPWRASTHRRRAGATCPWQEPLGDGRAFLAGAVVGLLALLAEKCASFIAQ
jgi:hypothetical protein